MKKERIFKYIKGMQVVPTLVYGATCISVLLYLCGILFTEDYWYFVLYALCLFCLAFYKYRNVEFYLRYRKRLCLLMGVVFCLIAHSVNVNSTSNYLYFSDPEHSLVIEEGYRSHHHRDGFLDIYKKKGVFKFYIDRFEVEDAHPLISADLIDRGGNTFKASNSYKVGGITFTWINDNTLKISHVWGESMEITLD